MHHFDFAAADLLEKLFHRVSREYRLAVQPLKTSSIRNCTMVNRSPHGLVLGKFEIHPALTSISCATSVNERFSLVTVKSSNRARSRMTFSFATRATYLRCDTPDSRVRTRCCIASILAVRRQTTVFLAETTPQQSSSSARSSIARASKSRLTPREA